MDSVAGFDWDESNRTKCQKHGVAIAEIESLFASAPVFATDVGHSPHEERVRAVGQAASGRFVFVVFTVRHKAGKSLIRPISARYMHRKEIRGYEQTGP